MTIADKFVVTTVRKESINLITEAKIWSKLFNVQYLPRACNGSLDKILKSANIEAILIATKHGPEVYSKLGKFFFHPSMAALRIKSLIKGEQDNFVKATGLKEGMRILDCTMGLASDAIIASYVVGTTGKVVALEASKLIHFVVSNGLQSYTTDDIDLKMSMQKIVRSEERRVGKEC